MMSEKSAEEEKPEPKKVEAPQKNSITAVQPEPKIVVEEKKAEPVDLLDLL